MELNDEAYKELYESELLKQSELHNQKTKLEALVNNWLDYECIRRETLLSSISDMTLRETLKEKPLEELETYINKKNAN